MRTNEFLDAIREAFGRNPNTLSIDDTPESVQEWDSVGHLSIIATIDEELGVPVEEDQVLAALFQEAPDSASVRPHGGTLG